MTELDAVHDLEERHYQDSLRFLGDSVSLVEDFVQLYQRAIEIAEGSPLAARDEYFMGMQFLLGARYQLVAAILACLRGHTQDVYGSTRMAIEVVAFAARVKRHPQFAEIWRDASQDDNTYAEYREKFKKLFPEDHAQLRELSARYDYCAKQTHPSIHSFAGRGRVEETETHYHLKFNYFQLQDDGSEPVRSFIWVLNTHVLIGETFREVLAPLLKADAAAYEVQANAVAAKLASHTARWLKQIPSLRPTWPVRPWRSIP